MDVPGVGPQIARCHWCHFQADVALLVQGVLRIYLISPIERASNRMQNMSTNLTMSTAGGRIVCKQCQATSKRTRLQCKAPAIKGKNVCRTHGGRSTGPETEQGRQRCAEAKTLHGRQTRKIRAERSRKSAEFHELVALGNSIGLFNGKVALRGRPPKGG
jgi:hypothetical protein